MSATTPSAEHDNVNPFAARQPAPPPTDDPTADDAPPDDSDAQPAETPAKRVKSEREQIEFKMRMAAGREAKRLERERQRTAPITPDKPVAETERLRQKLTNFLPDTTSLEIWKVIDGKAIWVGDYDARDVSSSKNVRQFILKNLYKKHKAQTWEIVHVASDGKERAPYRLNMDPDAQGAEGDSVSDRLEAMLRDSANKPSAVKEAIEALKNLKEMNASDEPQPPQPTTMVEFLMLREAMAPKEDPRVARLADELRDIKALLSQPPPAPIQLPPPAETFGFRDALALAEKMNAPLVEMLKEVRAQAADQAKQLRDEIKEARKSTATGGHGGLEGLRDQLKLLKEIDTERGGGGGTDITKLVTAVGGFLKDMKANDPNQQPAASPKIESAPAPGPLTFPPGTAELAAKITEAKDDNERVSALMILYQHIMQSGDPLFLRFHSVIVEHAKKGEAAEVREYVEGFLDALKATLPEATRKAAMAAYDAKADGIVKALSES